MLSGRDYRLAYDVREVCSDCVIPIHPHQAQRGTGNETSADAKKAAKNSDDKADNGKVDRVDV